MKARFEFDSIEDALHFLGVRLKVDKQPYRYGTAKKGARMSTEDTTQEPTTPTNPAEPEPDVTVNPAAPDAQPANDDSPADPDAAPEPTPDEGDEAK